MADSSAPTRSQAGMSAAPRSCSSKRLVTAPRVASSSSNASVVAKRAARSGRMGSARRQSSDVMRTSLRRRSRSPPVGSMSAPALVKAIALTVRSRRRRSPSNEPAPSLSGTKSSTSPAGPATRQWRRSTSSANGAPPVVSAKRRALTSGSPTSQSRSVDALPSSASLTAPPTRKARLARP